MVILTPTFCSEKCWRTPQREAPHWYVHLMDNRDFAVSCSSTSHFHLKKGNILFTLKSRIKPVSRAAMGLSAIATTKTDATDQPSWGDFFLFHKDFFPQRLKLFSFHSLSHQAVCTPTSLPPLVSSCKICLLLDWTVICYLYKKHPFCSRQAGIILSLCKFG